MFGLRTGEIITIVIILFIVFSASRMATLGDAIGAFFYSFKKASKGDAFIDAHAVSSGAKSEKVIDAPKS